MSATTDPLGVCLCPVEPYHFDKITVRCAFKCKNPGYRTYSHLHRHYLTVHNICLHRVARLDPNDEVGFCRQLTSFVATFTGGKATPQRSRGHNPGGHAVSYASRLPATSPFLHIAGPSHLGAYQTPGDTVFHQSPKDPGQDGPSDPLGWHAVPTSSESPYRNHSPNLGLPAPGEIGPSRPLAIYPTIRHQPYPQSRPHPQGPCVGRSPVRGQSKGKGREFPLGATNHGPQTPKTPSWGSRLESPIPTARPNDGTFVESSQYPSAGLQYSRLQQPVTETSTPTQWALSPQYLADAMASDTFRQPVTAQGYRSPTRSTRESECMVLVDRTRPTQFKYQQPQPTVTGSCGLTTDFPTPPVDTASMLDGSPLRHPANQPKRSPGRVNQKYPRPVNGSTTFQLARQARENRRQELSTKSDTAREMFEPPLRNGQTRAAADVRDLTPDHDWGQNCAWSITPDPLEMQAEEAGVLLIDQRDRPANPPTEMAPPHTRSSSVRALFPVEEPIGRSPPLRASATALQGQARPPPSRQVNDNQWLGEPSAAWNRPAPSEPCGGVRVPKQSNSAVAGPVERPRTAEEPAFQVLMAKEQSQEPAPIQPSNSGECYPTVATNEEGEALREEGSDQEPFPDTLWRGWGLVKTPDGMYLPETFNPFPHELEDLTDQRQLGERSEEDRTGPRPGLAATTEKLVSRSCPHL